MSDKEVVIKNLKNRKEEINEELEFKNIQSLEDELYEIEDTLKKLGVNENDTISFNDNYDGESKSSNYVD